MRCGAVRCFPPGSPSGVRVVAAQAWLGLCWPLLISLSFLMLLSRRTRNTLQDATVSAVPALYGTSMFVVTPDRIGAPARSVTVQPSRKVISRYGVPKDGCDAMAMLFLRGSKPSPGPSCRQPAPVSRQHKKKVWLHPPFFDATDSCAFLVIGTQLECFIRHRECADTTYMRAAPPCSFFPCLLRSWSCLAVCRPQFFVRTADVTGSVKLPEGTEMVMPGDTVSLTIDVSRMCSRQFFLCSIGGLYWTRNVQGGRMLCPSWHAYPPGKEAFSRGKVEAGVRHVKVGCAFFLGHSSARACHAVRYVCVWTVMCVVNLFRSSVLVVRCFDRQAICAFQHRSSQDEGSWKEIGVEQAPQSCALANISPPPFVPLCLFVVSLSLPQLICPVVMHEGLRFALREGGRTVGAGVVSSIIA